MRASTLKLLVAAVALCIALPGVSAAQTGTDPLGAQSATPLQTNGTPDQGDVEGEFGSGGNNPTGDTEPTADDSPSGASLPSTDSANPGAKASGAAGSQAASLPFTGFMAIPVLLAGLMLLGSGLVIRSRTAA